MRIGRWLLALALAGVGMIGGAAPARAECVMVTFEVHWWDQPDTYPLGQRDTCVTQTQWAQTDKTQAGHNEQEEHVPGMPRGFLLQVWLTEP